MAAAGAQYCERRAPSGTHPRSHDVRQPVRHHRAGRAVPDADRRHRDHPQLGGHASWHRTAARLGVVHREPHRLHLRDPGLGDRAGHRVLPDRAAVPAGKGAARDRLDRGDRAVRPDRPRGLDPGGQRRGFGRVPPGGLRPSARRGLAHRPRPVVPPATGPDELLDLLGDVPDVDVHPSQHAALAQPEGDELPFGEVPADHELVVPVGPDVADVLHAQVVLVGVEVRQPVVRCVRAHDRPGGDRALPLRVGPVLRTEHWANAQRQGAVAARSIMGADASDDRLPYFYTDQYDLGMEYVGYVGPDGYDELVVRGDLAKRELIAFWLREGRVLAGMNVNVWDATEQIEELIR